MTRGKFVAFRARRRSWAFGKICVIAGAVAPAATFAQDLTPHPEAWRPISYANLQAPSANTATYADIWKDAIGRNNRFYRDRGDVRFAIGNAPVTEAHFVIWSSRRSAVLSILNTAVGCTVKTALPSAHVTIKLCPLRVAIFEGVKMQTMDGGRACFLEVARPTGAESGAAAYAAYDVPTRTIRTGVIVDHESIDGCSLNIPLPHR